MLRYRLFTPMGENDGEVELATPTVQPGVTRKRLLHDAYDSRPLVAEGGTR